MKKPFEFNYDTDRPVAVRIGKEIVWISLADGRVIGNPLSWHPWLAEASPQQQANYELGVFSVDWPDLDEGLDVEGMLWGIKPPTRSRQAENV